MKPESALLEAVQTNTSCGSKEEQQIDGPGSGILDLEHQSQPEHQKGTTPDAQTGEKAQKQAYQQLQRKTVQHKYRTPPSKIKMPNPR